MMENLEYRGIESSFYRHQCVNGEIVSASHPFAYLCFFLSQKGCKILLFEVLLFQYLMDSIYNLER